MFTHTEYMNVGRSGTRDSDFGSFARTAETGLTGHDNVENMVLHSGVICLNRSYSQHKTPAWMGRCPFGAKVLMLAPTAITVLCKVCVTCVLQL